MIRHQWLLIVAIAAGLVGMHHLVAENSGHAGHSAPTPMTMAAGPGSSLMSPTPTEHADAGPLTVNPVVARTALASVLVRHPCCGDVMAMVGYCCLAVLTTISTLTGVLLFVAAWRRPWEPGHLLVGVSAVAARAPPIGSVRFTQLCVLRH